jgi:hypothetical protein
MYNLFLSEYQRYKVWAIIVCLLQFMLWGILSQFKPVLAGYSEQSAMTILLISLISITFGLVQMLLHKRKNNWTYLVHRPLCEYNIHLAITLAGALLLFIALVLPFIIMVFGINLLSNQVVDTRYYIYCLYLFIACLVPYYAATFIAISRSWGAVLSLGMLFFVWRLTPTNYLVDLAISLLMLAWVYCLSRWSFKANLSVLPKEKSKLFIMHIAFLPGSFFLLYMSQAIYYHIPLSVINEHPDSKSIPGSYTEFWRLNLGDKAEVLLKDSEYPNKSAIIRQAKLADEKYLPIRSTTKTKIDQFYIQDSTYGSSDPQNNRHWVFSHDKMVFVGRNTFTGDITGYLGARGFVKAQIALTDADKFIQIPNIVHQHFLQTQDTIYELDFDALEMHVKHKLPTGEQYATRVTKPRNASFYTVSSFQNLYLFDAMDFREEGFEITSSNVIPHPADIATRFRVEYQVIVDGYLFYYQDNDFFGKNKSGGSLIKVNHDNSHQVLGEKRFNYLAHPLWIEYNSLVISPMLGVLFEEYRQWMSPSHNKDYLVAPSKVWMLSGVTTLLSALFTLILAFRLRLSLSFKVFWLVNSLLFALPGLISFVLLNIWRNNDLLLKSREEQTALLSDRTLA